MKSRIEEFTLKQIKTSENFRRNSKCPTWIYGKLVECIHDKLILIWKCISIVKLKKGKRMKYSRSSLVTAYKISIIPSKYFWICSILTETSSYFNFVLEIPAYIA